jgi:hypothetical protein
MEPVAACSRAMDSAAWSPARATATPAATVPGARRRRAATSIRLRKLTWRRRKNIGTNPCARISGAFDAAAHGTRGVTDLGLHRGAEVAADGGGDEGHGSRSTVDSQPASAADAAQLAPERHR